MNKNPLGLLPKRPDEKCNARTPRGYCKNKAGFRTSHYGEGRCWLHGGLSLMNNVARSTEASRAIYTKYLPTTLAIELAEIKADPLFSSLHQEYAMLKLIIQQLLKQLPADLSTMYGKPICSHCGDKLTIRQNGQKKKRFLIVPYNSASQQKRLHKAIQLIEVMSRIFEKISKHEERQKRFITISELESVVANWGRILMEYFGKDPRIVEVQNRILNSGFTRVPGEQDSKRMEVVRELQRKVRNNIVKQKQTQHKKYVTIHDAIKEVMPEFLEEDVEYSEELEEFDARELLAKLKNKQKVKNE